MAPRKQRRGGGDPSSGRSEVVGYVRGRLFGLALSPISGLMTSIPLFFACLFLVIGWKVGPQRMIDAARLRKLTSHTEGRVLESWLALDWNPAEMRDHHYWRALAKVSACVVVEYDGGWSSAIRKAFCGPSSPYSESWILADMRTFSAGVPFFWPRDANGFAIPEIRMSAATRQWLATHPEPDPLPNDPPTGSALESLRLDNDRPVDLAEAGWMRPAGTIPLVFDPHDPKGALPAGFVTEAFDLPPAWLSLGVFAFCLVPGVWIWTVAVQFLFGGLPRWVYRAVVIMPLLGLPWWGEWMPRYLGRLNWRAGEIVTEFIHDVDRRGFIASTAPDDALLAHGERITWRLDQGLYADTIGRLRFVPPNPPPKSKGAALRTLSESVTAQVNALDPSERAALFVHLRREKEGKLTGDGPAFLDAASKTMKDTGASPELRRAANSFLEAWGQYFNYPGGKSEP
jgi:hypothetical protein